jgi:AMP-binding enzyme/Phosphopantetheine attachment site/AMP-binding enzyme C-terminal domain
LAGVGEPGEIVVRTRHLSRGYLGDPDLSKRRFCSNPLGNSKDDRVYRTGDRGRYLPDGAVEFAGRIDNQIKLRGFRIEPEEIDNVLCESQLVSAAATILFEAQEGDSRLVSYLVLNKGQSSIADIRKRLRTQLPDYMVPQQFVVLDKIPVTPNGKLDRKSLPPPQQHTAARSGSVEAPQSATEQLLAGIWKDIIGCESISRTDNFFDLGGHSMLVIKAIARIEAKTGWRPSPRLFILETLAEIAAQCDLNGRQPTVKRPLFTKFRDLFNQGAAT